MLRARPRKCPRRWVDRTKANDVISAEARDFLAEKLNTPPVVMEPSEPAAEQRVAIDHLEEKSACYSYPGLSYIIVPAILQPGAA